MTKVKQNDATELEKKLSGEFFKDWAESSDVMTVTKIPVENIDGFLDQIQTSCKGNKVLGVSMDRNDEMVNWYVGVELSR